jgi:hypothetical protein
MKILRACLDWRVLTGLAGLGVAVYLVAPGLIAPAVPLLLLAACPLSMLVMMKAMGDHPTKSGPDLAEPGGADRAAALRRELADLGRRQEQVAGELRAIEAGRQDAARTSDTAPTSVR